MEYLKKKKIIRSKFFLLPKKLFLNILNIQEFKKQELQYRINAVYTLQLHSTQFFLYYIEMYKPEYTQVTERIYILNA